MRRRSIWGGPQRFSQTMNNDSANNYVCQNHPTLSPWLEYVIAILVAKKKQTTNQMCVGYVHVSVLTSFHLTII
jgi:hypothetical protein